MMFFPDWEDVIQNIEVNRDDSFKIDTPEASNSWKYIHHRLDNDLDIPAFLRKSNKK